MPKYNYYIAFGSVAMIIALIYFNYYNNHENIKYDIGYANKMIKEQNFTELAEIVDFFTHQLYLKKEFDDQDKIKARILFNIIQKLKESKLDEFDNQYIYIYNDHLGKFLFKSKDYDLALKAYLENLEINRNVIIESKIYHNIGNCYRMMEKNKKAIDNYLKSIQIIIDKEEMQDDVLLTGNYVFPLLVKEGVLDTAEEILNIMLIINISNDNIKDIIVNYIDLSYIYELRTNNNKKLICRPLLEAKKLLNNNKSNLEYYNQHNEVILKRNNIINCW